MYTLQVADYEYVDGPSRFKKDSDHSTALTLKIRHIELVKEDIQHQVYHNGRVIYQWLWHDTVFGDLPVDVPTVQRDVVITLTPEEYSVVETSLLMYWVEFWKFNEEHEPGDEAYRAKLRALLTKLGVATVDENEDN